MSQRITMPNGNMHSSFVMASIKLYEGRGVVCLDARGKPLEWIPIADPEKGRRARDMLTSAIRGERRYRTLDWSFLDEVTLSAPPLPLPNASNAERAPSAPLQSKPGK
jgi:hypothetical protein